MDKTLTVADAYHKFEASGGLPVAVVVDFITEIGIVTRDEVMKYLLKGLFPKFNL